MLCCLLTLGGIEDQKEEFTGQQWLEARQSLTGPEDAFRSMFMRILIIYPHGAIQQARGSDVVYLEKA